VLGLSETHWKDQRDYLSDDIRIISSGGEDRARGVAVLLDKEWARRVTVVEQKSDRLMMIKLKNEPTDIVIVQVYMPTSACEDAEIEKMYEQIEDIVDKQKGTDYVIVMGDWNAVVGEGREGNEVGQFGLGTRNERGERLIEFCQWKKFIVSNTWFEQEKRRRYTYKNPGDRARYQNDFILVRQRFRNSVKKARSYPGADNHSDHNLVAMKVRIELKRIRTMKRVRKWDVEKLKKNGEKFGKVVDETLVMKTGQTVEERWKEVKTCMTKAAEEVIGYKKAAAAKKPWVTTAMLTKMDEQRRWKGVNTDEGRKQYNKMNELRTETDAAKEKWWDEECKELEMLEKKGRVDLVYSKVKKLTKKPNSANKSSGIKDSKGQLVTDADEVKNRWKEYIETLYDKVGNRKKKILD